MKDDIFPLWWDSLAAKSACNVKGKAAAAASVSNPNNGVLYISCLDDDDDVAVIGIVVVVVVDDVEDLDSVSGPVFLLGSMKCPFFR